MGHADVRDAGSGVGIQPVLEREIRRQLIEHVRHAAELVGNHRPDFGQPPPGAFPHQMLAVSAVYQSNNVVDAAAVAGQMPFYIGRGHVALFPQQGAHIVEGTHGIGVMLLPAEHPHPAHPAGFVGDVAVNAAEIGCRKAGELFGHAVHRPGHLLHGLGGEFHPHHNRMPQTVHGWDVPHVADEAAELFIQDRGQDDIENARRRDLVKTHDHLEPGIGAQIDHHVHRDKGGRGRQLAETGEKPRQQAAERKGRGQKHLIRGCKRHGGAQHDARDAAPLFLTAAGKDQNNQDGKDPAGGNAAELDGGQRHEHHRRHRHHARLLLRGQRLALRLMSDAEGGRYEIREAAREQAFPRDRQKVEEGRFAH